MKKTMIFAVLASVFCCGALEFDGVFQSHMVLQQGRTLAVSGRAVPDVHPKSWTQHQRCIYEKNNKNAV